jgi:hypothetical protein
MKTKSRNLSITRLLAVALCVTPVGCTSIRSTLFSYDGCQDCARVKKHLKGVPTTLDVPTHLQVSVWRTRWGAVDSKTGTVTFTPELETREVNITPICQKEIFTVDFKRPASGTLNYKATFDGQYITGVDNHLEDTTIKDSAALVAAILKSIPVPVARDVAQSNSSLSGFQDVIATDVFAISEPDIENRIQAFLGVYVNQCHTTCPPCVYPPPAPSCRTACEAANR